MWPFAFYRSKLIRAFYSTLHKNAGWYLVFNLLVNRFRFVRELFMIKEDDQDKKRFKQDKKNA